MAPEDLECDYLVVGAGAMGMAFTDTLVAETQGHSVIIADKRSQPGGHWNDAYPYVRLHQPSHYYGVNSRRLEQGPPPSSAEEMAELASGLEVATYFRRVLEGLVATGRVRFMPTCEAVEGGRRLVSMLEPGRSWQVTVRRKVVDATYMRVEVPATRSPSYAVESGALVVPPNRLPAIACPHPLYVVIGSGKTGIDAVLWLLRHGVTPERLLWVMPRDAWLLNRAHIQPGRVVQRAAAVTAEVEAVEAEVQAAKLDRADAQLLAHERVGVFMRLDKSRWPEAFRCATVSPAEFAELQRVDRVVRLGHVREVGKERLLLDGGEVHTGEGTLHVDCTADALARRPAVPIFSEKNITLQSVQMCQQVFSAALLAHLEAKWPNDDQKKNRICVPVPHPDSTGDFATCRELTERNMRACFANGLGWWLWRSRLWSMHHERVLPSLWEAAKAAWQMRRLRRNRKASQSAPGAAASANVGTLPPPAKL